MGKIISWPQPLNRIIVGGNPITRVDPSGLRVSQVWRPLNSGAWPAGYHTAINVNGQVYGFHPEGVVVENPADYAWGSHEVAFDEGNSNDAAFTAYLEQAASGGNPKFTSETYNLLSGYSCMNFAADAIEKAPLYNSKLNANAQINSNKP